MLNAYHTLKDQERFNKLTCSTGAGMAPHSALEAQNQMGAAGTPGATRGAGGAAGSTTHVSCLTTGVIYRENVQDKEQSSKACLRKNVR